METGRESKQAGTGCLPSIRAKLSLSVEDAYCSNCDDFLLATPSSFFSFLLNYWHAISQLQFPDLCDSVLNRSTFPALPGAALLNLHQSLLSFNFRINTKPLIPFKHFPHMPISAHLQFDWLSPFISLSIMAIPAVLS